MPARAFKSVPSNAKAAVSTVRPAVQVSLDPEDVPVAIDPTAMPSQPAESVDAAGETSVADTKYAAAARAEVPSTPVAKLPSSLMHAVQPEYAPLPSLYPTGERPQTPDNGDFDTRMHLDNALDSLFGSPYNLGHGNGDAVDKDMLPPAASNPSSPAAPSIGNAAAAVAAAFEQPLVTTHRPYPQPLGHSTVQISAPVLALAPPAPVLGSSQMTSNSPFPLAPHMLAMNIQENQNMHLQYQNQFHSQQSVPTYDTEMLKMVASQAINSYISSLALPKNGTPPGFDSMGSTNLALSPGPLPFSLPRTAPSKASQPASSAAPLAAPAAPTSAQPLALPPAPSKSQPGQVVVSKPALKPKKLVASQWKKGANKEVKLVVPSLSVSTPSGSNAQQETSASGKSGNNEEKKLDWGAGQTSDDEIGLNNYTKIQASLDGAKEVYDGAKQMLEATKHLKGIQWAQMPKLQEFLSQSEDNMQALLKTQEKIIQAAIKKKKEQVELLDLPVDQDQDKYLNLRHKKKILKVIKPAEPINQAAPIEKAQAAPSLKDLGRIPKLKRMASKDPSQLAVEQSLVAAVNQTPTQAPPSTSQASNKRPKLGSAKQGVAKYLDLEAKEDDGSGDEDGSKEDPDSMFIKPFPVSGVLRGLSAKENQAEIKLFEYIGKLKPGHNTPKFGPKVGAGQHDYLTLCWPAVAEIIQVVKDAPKLPCQLNQFQPNNSTTAALIQMVHETDFLTFLKYCPRLLQFDLNDKLFQLHMDFALVQRAMDAKKRSGSWTSLGLMMIRDNSTMTYHSGAHAQLFGGAFKKMWCCAKGAAYRLHNTMQFTPANKPSDDQLLQVTNASRFLLQKVLALSHTEGTTRQPITETIEFFIRKIYQTLLGVFMMAESNMLMKAGVDEDRMVYKEKHLKAVSLNGGGLVENKSWHDYKKEIVGTTASFFGLGVSSWWLTFNNRRNFNMGDVFSVFRLGRQRYLANYPKTKDNEPEITTDIPAAWPHTTQFILDLLIECEVDQPNPDWNKATNLIVSRLTDTSVSQLLLKDIYEEFFLRGLSMGPTGSPAPEVVDEDADKSKAFINIFGKIEALIDGQEVVLPVPPPQQEPGQTTIDEDISMEQAQDSDDSVSESDLIKVAGSDMEIEDVVEKDMGDAVESEEEEEVEKEEDEEEEEDSRVEEAIKGNKGKGKAPAKEMKGKPKGYYEPPVGSPDGAQFKTAAEIKGGIKYKYTPFDQDHPLWEKFASLGEVVVALKDVVADGNCGYRAIAVAMEYPNKDGWKRVREELFHELTSNYDNYTDIMIRTNGNILEVDAELDAIGVRVKQCKSPATQEFWLSLPDCGELVANCYGRPLISLSKKGNMCFIPRWTQPVLLDPIVLLFDSDSSHFLCAQLGRDEDGLYPMPRFTNVSLKRPHKMHKEWIKKLAPYVELGKEFGL